MSDPILIFGLESAARVNPDADGSGAGSELGLGGDSEAVGEGGDLRGGKLEDLRVIGGGRVRGGVA